MIALELKNEMSYYYGTEHYYENGLYRFKYTDGVKAFCEKAKAFWFLDVVNSLLFEKETRERMEGGFIFVKLIVKEDNTAVVRFKDREKVFYEQSIPFTDCPIGEWVFYFDSGVLMWNGEY